MILCKKCNQNFEELLRYNTRLGKYFSHFKPREKKRNYKNWRKKWTYYGCKISPRLLDVQYNSISSAFNGFDVLRFRYLIPVYKSSKQKEISILSSDEMFIVIMHNRVRLIKYWLLFFFEITAHRRVESNLHTFKSQLSLFVRFFLRTHPFDYVLDYNNCLGIN